MCYCTRPPRRPTREGGHSQQPRTVRTWEFYTYDIYTKHDILYGTWYEYTKHDILYGIWYEYVPGTYVVCVFSVNENDDLVLCRSNPFVLIEVRARFLGGKSYIVGITVMWCQIPRTW